MTSVETFSDEKTKSLENFSAYLAAVESTSSASDDDQEFTNFNLYNINYDLVIFCRLRSSATLKSLECNSTCRLSVVFTLAGVTAVKTIVPNLVKFYLQGFGKLDFLHFGFPLAVPLSARDASGTRKS